MKKQEAPPLTGPSEFGTSITMTASPDMISLDGASQSLITVTVRDANAQPVRNLSMRAEIVQGATVMDYGTLSARNIVTGADGRATVVYTAPPGPSGPTPDTFTIVDIYVTPVGTDYSNTVPRFVTIRLVPPGVVVPPDGLRPQFTFAPASPTEGQSIRFEACSDGACSPNTNPVAGYDWDFGDGSTASGRVVNHTYTVAGPYTATLTISDAFGRAASTLRTVTVGAGVAPTVSFFVLPITPSAGQRATFDASATRPSPGRRIVSYTWDFGDGDMKPNLTSPVTTHDFLRAGTYTVTLVVTDDLGKVAQAAQAVNVLGDAPIADFTFTPPNPVAGTNVVFTSTSTASSGRTIVSYFWTFSSGQGTATGAQVTKSFPTPGTIDVTLGVTDSAGQTSTVSKSVLIR